MYLYTKVILQRNYFILIKWINHRARTLTWLLALATRLEDSGFFGFCFSYCLLDLKAYSCLWDSDVPGFFLLRRKFCHLSQVTLWYQSPPAPTRLLPSSLPLVLLLFHVIFLLLFKFPTTFIGLKISMPTALAPAVFSISWVESSSRVHRL